MTVDLQHRNGILRRAFTARLTEVESLMAMQLPELKQMNKGYEETDSEETLRLLMVRYFPKLTGNILTNEELQKIFSLLNQLYHAALTSDLRFLDAWNNLYEALKANQMLKDTTEASVFLTQYAQLLKHHLGSLAG